MTATACAYILSETFAYIATVVQQGIHNAASEHISQGRYHNGSSFPVEMHTST